MTLFLSYLINGISLGSVYAIIALGYTMVYGIAKMLNFAHGDVIMIGAYVSFCAMQYLGLPKLVSVVLAMVVCTALGIVIEGLAYKPLRKAPSLAVLITAIGVSYFLQNSALLIWGSAPKSYPSVISLGSLTLMDGQLVIMGGGHCGANASPAAEFNFYADPEAAKIVMDSAIPKVILPLDATWRACLSEEKCKELAQLGTPEAKVAAALVQKRIDNLKVNDVSEHNYALRHQAGTVAGAMLYRYDNHMAPIHDALAIAYLINENVVTELADANVDIDIAGGLCDGRMVADFHNTKKCKAPVTAKVALNSDAGLFTDMLFAALGK